MKHISRTALLLGLSTTWASLAAADEASTEAAQKGESQPELAEEQSGLITDKSTHRDDQVEVDLAGDTGRDSANDQKPDDRRKREPEPDEDFGHAMQFGVRAGIVGGYRMVFRYDDSPYCRKPEPGVSAADQNKFCGHTAPLAMDLGLSFAPLDGVEPFVWGRFGLSGEEETNTEPVLFAGAGVRIYTMSDARFKIFIQPALGYEFEGGGDDPAYDNFEYKGDIVFHVSAGPQLEIARYVAVYADAGLTLGILRALHSELELSLGLQLRAP